MKAKGRSPSPKRNTRGTGVLSFPLSDVLSIIPNFLSLLPNNQFDNEVQAAGEVTALANFDFREKKTKKTDFSNHEAKPATLRIWDTEFTDLFLLGTFVYAVKDLIAGFSNFGDLLFVMMSPTRLFEKRNADHQSPRGDTNLATLKSRALNRASNLLELGGLDYMRACFEYARDLAENQLPVVIVLGEQEEDRDVNCEPYDCRGFITGCKRKNNVHQYTTNQIAERNKVPANIEIFHINMKAFENAQIDSKDIETLVKIYEMSMGDQVRPRPLIIHCTDGMDRSGGLALAFRLFHNWGRVFTSLSATEIVENIKREHDDMQQKRGPSFCTATSKRIQGAVLLSGIMKAIQKSKELIERNRELAPQLHKKDYLQIIYLLEDKNDEGNKELISILKARLVLEKLYFEKFSTEINHPQVDLKIVETILYEELNEIKRDPQKEELEDRFNYLKANYRNSGFNEQALRSLVSLKCDVETYQVNLKINAGLNNISDVSSKEDINKKLISIESNQNEDKDLKLRRKKVLLIEINAFKLYDEIERLIDEYSNLASYTIVGEFRQHKKLLTQNFREAQYNEPNVGKFENLFLRLQNILSKMHESKTKEKDSLNEAGKKTLVGSIRGETSPRGSRRGSLFGSSLFSKAEQPPSIEAPADEGLSTSPRKGFLGLPKSNAGSRRGSRAQPPALAENSKETQQGASEFSTGDPTVGQTSALSSSLSRLLGRVSPPRSRRGSTLVPTAVAIDSDLSTSGIRESDPTNEVDPDEIRKKLTKLAAERDDTDRVGKQIETSPRGNRKHLRPSVDNRRISQSAEEDIGDFQNPKADPIATEDSADQLANDLDQFGF